MDPQIKSILTSILLMAATSAAGWATAHGVIPGGDQATIANDLVAAALWAITGGVAWLKTRAHTPSAQIAAVNDAPNGVKVVDERAPEPKVTAPLK
jgi:hypothetical protein